MEAIEQQVRALLRDNLLNLSLAIIISFAGLAALALVRTRTKIKDPILLWLGLFAAIYGIRQLAKNSLIPLTFAGPAEFWQPSDSIIVEGGRGIIGLGRIALVSGEPAASPKGPERRTRQGPADLARIGSAVRIRRAFDSRERARIVDHAG